MSNQAIYDADLLVATCRDWVAIGCNPLEKIQCFKFSSPEGSVFAFGMLLRGTSDQWVLESEKRYSSRATAISAIGRALDKEDEKWFL